MKEAAIGCVCVVLCLLAACGCAVSPRTGHPVGGPSEPVVAAADAPCADPGRTYHRVGLAPLAACGRAPLTCPPSTYLRPSNGWAYQDAAQCERFQSEGGAFRRSCEVGGARRKWGWLTAAAAAGTIVYGVNAWGWGDSSFGVADEGWFGESTAHGGGDKVGHATAAHIATSVFAAINRGWGMSRKEAALRGAITSFTYLSMLEVGDGMSKRYGFSFSDLAADALGCAFGYVHATSPWVHRVLDLRWQLWPTSRTLEGESFDLTTDYEGSTYLLAINVGGLLGPQPSAWDLLDLQVGYQPRGYTIDTEPNERWLFVGVGLNLANVLRRLRFPYAAFFDYYQLPWISLRFGIDLNTDDTQILWGP